MAGYRQIHTQIWKDEWYIELEPDEKLLFIYLFSNDLASICGLYKIPLRVMCNETGLDADRVKQALDKFQQSNKIFYQDGTMWVVNMTKYHKNPSELTQKKVQADIDLIPDCHVKRLYQYHLQNPGYPIDTLFIRYRDHVLKAEAKTKAETKEEEKAEEKKPAAPPAFTASMVGLDAFTKVTGMVAYPGSEVMKCEDAMNNLTMYHRTDLVEYLQPFFDAWIKRGYQKTNCAWLYDWAISGEIPPEKHSNGSNPNKNGHGSNGSKPGKPPAKPLTEEEQRIIYQTSHPEEEDESYEMSEAMKAYIERTKAGGK